MGDNNSGRVLVGFASLDGLAVDEHFGHAQYWQIYDLRTTRNLWKREKCRPFAAAHAAKILSLPINC